MNTGSLPFHAGVPAWPKIIVLETEQLMKTFRAYAEEHGKPRDLPDDMVSEIIACFKKQHSAELRLDEFVTSIVSGDYQYPLGDYVDIGIASFILELGETILQQILGHYLYDIHGNLQYRHMTPRRPESNFVSLRRIERDEYPPPAYYTPTASGTRSF